jgi:hypothetical protein
VSGPAVPVAAAGGGRTPAQIAQRQELGQAAALENIQVQGARSQGFNKVLDDEIRPQAQAADTVSSIRKQQFELFDRPGIDAGKIFGIANGAGRSATDQTWTILRDVLTGKFKGGDDELGQRLANLGLNPQEQAALLEYQQSIVAVNAANLKKVSGGGSVSDAEQAVNRQAGMDPTRVPALSAYNIMAQSQFDADRARWKADWALTSRATNALELDRDWRRESQRLS